MRRILLLVLSAAACGGSPKKDTTPPPPLADTKPEAPADKSAEKPAEKPAEPPEPPPGPIDVTVSAPKVTVKLVNAGKGKKAPLKLAPKQGDKQNVELVVDFKQSTSAGGKSQDDVIPTIVLSGAAEVKDVAKDGTATYELAVSATDAREVKDSPIPLPQFKDMLAGLAGATIGGTVGPNGVSSDMKMHMDKANRKAAAAMQVLQIVLPTWPVFPTEPVGVGAKWQVTANVKLQGQLDVTQTTDYEVLKHEGKTWTLKGTTKVGGKDQPLGEATFSVAGSGTNEVSVVDGAFYPTMKTQISTELTAKPKDPTQQTIQLALVQGVAVTPK